MADSVILDFMHLQELGELHEKMLAKKDNVYSYLVKESREVLEKKLDKNEMELVDQYTRSLYSQEEYIDFQINIKVLNYGIKIGMQLQQAFDEIDDL